MEEMLTLRPACKCVLIRGVEEGIGVHVGGVDVSVTGTDVVVPVLKIVGVFETIENGPGEAVSVDGGLAGSAGAESGTALQATRNRIQIAANAFFMPTPFPASAPIVLLHS